MDILEIALLAEESGNVYHSYIKINYSVPKLVQLLTGITELLKLTGFHLETRWMAMLNLFDVKEHTLNTKAHGGYAHNFPILLASCMKHNYNDYTVLTELIVSLSCRTQATTARVWESPHELRMRKRSNDLRPT